MLPNSVRLTPIHSAWTAPHKRILLQTKTSALQIIGLPDQTARFKQTRQYQDAEAAKNGEAIKQPANAEQAADTDQKVKKAVKQVAFYSAGKLEFWKAHGRKSVPSREVQFNYLTEAKCCP